VPNQPSFEGLFLRFEFFTFRTSLKEIRPLAGRVNLFCQPSLDCYWGKGLGGEMVRYFRNGFRTKVTLNLIWGIYLNSGSEANLNFAVLS
jgi:hypothetical protein